MGIEFLIKDKLSNQLVLWSFKVNDDGFIDVYVAGNLTDALEELGEIKDYRELVYKVTSKLMSWEVEWHSYAQTS